MDLTFEQKVAAIHSLENLGNSLIWRFNTHGAAPRGDWYVYGEKVEKTDGAIIGGAMGYGATPEEALNDLWDKLTTYKEDQRVVIDAFAGRRAVRWNGFMWEPYKEPEAVKA